MNSFLNIVNTLRDLSKNIKIDKEKSKGNYNHNGIDMEFNVTIPLYEKQYVTGNLIIDGIDYSIHLPSYITVFYYDCNFIYHNEYNSIGILPKLALIDLPYGYGTDYNYFFDIYNGEDKIVFHGYEYKELNFEPFRKNLKDWDDDYLFYLKLQGII